jgi:hypothetical protein
VLKPLVPVGKPLWKTLSLREAVVEPVGAVVVLGSAVLAVSHLGKDSHHQISS